MKQTDLFIDGLTLDVGPVPVEAKLRLNRQALAMLARLQRGPATNRELAAMGLSYTRRISDLRANGYDVQCFGHEKATGVAYYRLVK